MEIATLVDSPRSLEQATHQRAAVRDHAHRESSAAVLNNPDVRRSPSLFGLSRERDETLNPAHTFEREAQRDPFFLCPSNEEGFIRTASDAGM